MTCTLAVFPGATTCSEGLGAGFETTGALTATGSGLAAAGACTACFSAPFSGTDFLGAALFFGAGGRFMGGSPSSSSESESASASASSTTSSTASSSSNSNASPSKAASSTAIFLDSPLFLEPRVRRSVTGGGGAGGEYGWRNSRSCSSVSSLPSMIPRKSRESISSYPGTSGVMRISWNKAWGTFCLASGQTVKKFLYFAWIAGDLEVNPNHKTACGSAVVKSFQVAEGVAASLPLSCLLNSLAALSKLFHSSTKPGRTNKAWRAARSLGASFAVRYWTEVAEMSGLTPCICNCVTSLRISSSAGASADAVVQAGNNACIQPSASMAASTRNPSSSCAISSNS